VRIEDDLRDLLWRKASEVSDDAAIPPRVVHRARVQRVVTAVVASLVVVAASFGAVAAFREGAEDPVSEPIATPPRPADDRGFVVADRLVLVDGAYKLWVRRQGDRVCLRHTFPGNDFLSRECGPIPGPQRPFTFTSQRAGDQLIVAAQATMDLRRVIAELEGGQRVVFGDVQLPSDLAARLRLVTAALPGDAIGCVTARFSAGEIRQEPLFPAHTGQRFLAGSRTERLARAGC
jgi:hypothetical protein